MISVIIPVYNNKNTIRGAIDSVLTQEGVELEVVCVDDGSADGTDQVLSDIAREDPRVRVIRQENAGPGAARNRGIEEAHGEYISFVDSDDKLMPGALKLLLDAIEEPVRQVSDIAGKSSTTTDRVDIASAGLLWRRTFADGRTRDFGPMEALQKYNGVHTMPDSFFDLFNANLLNNMVGKLFRRDIIEANGVRVPTELDMGEDCHFVLRYLRHAKNIRIIPQYIYLYENDNSTLSARYRENMFAKRKISVDMLREYIRSQGLSENICYFLYEKLLVAQTMQDIEFKRPKAERVAHIEAALNTDEVREAIEKVSPEGKMQKAIAFVVGKKNPGLITAFSRVSSMVRKLAADKVNPVSI